ncbi:MAG: type II toxin-antitoxin system PemK/MazF family toxin [Acidobacteria bacterium]|nr:type II toxin-antitoxin system PemK/MazF family toxin [Pyrinomonadaceae bacterium]MCC6451444.1 type II toxin-antitoxin system PemK/MazF family toxin [Acidobacteriota bacterium]
MVERFDIFLLNLDEEVTKEAKNTRPCVVISPDEMNRHLNSVIIAPISASTERYPTRVAVNVLNSERSLVLDQLRTVDKERLVKRIGSIGKSERKATIERLQELFAE